MSNIFLFSLITGLASALVLIPFSKRNKSKEKESKKGKAGGLLFGAVIILLIIGVFSFYYLTNLDRNFTSLWALAIPVTLLGAFFASGR